MKLPRSGRCDLRGVADLLKPLDESVGGLVDVGTIEVGRAQVVPGGGGHGGGHGDDGLLGATPGTQTVKLRLRAQASSRRTAAPSR